MKKLLLVLWLTLPGFIYCNAQEPDDTVKSLLWSISSADMKQPSYLFGTIHLICPEDYIWTPQMQKSLESAREVCLEMDMDDPQLMLMIAEGMLIKNGELKDYFTEEQYKKLRGFLADSFGMDLSMFRQMKPAALQTLFAAQIVDCEAPLTYETEIVEMAKKQSIEITGLEEPQEQIALLDSMPADSIISNIMEAIEQDTEGKAEYREMVNAYKNQDLPALNRLIQSSGGELGNMDIYIGNRNEKWIGRMIDKMDQQPVFFAVGAGHLPGSNGVISLLRRAGYIVEPVK